MKRNFFILVVLLVSVAGIQARSYEGEHGDKNMVLGGYLSSGFAMVAGDGYEDRYLLDREDRTAKYAIGGDAYFDYYFTPMFAIDAEFGFLTKGIRFSYGNTHRKEALTYMEIPVCFKFDIHHFQGTVGFALFVALSGTSITKEGDDETKHKWNDDDWQYVHRANFGPKLAFGYAIPVGPVFIVPGMSWSMHFINDLNNDEIPGDHKYRMRANNLMINAGVEWGF